MKVLIIARTMLAKTKTDGGKELTVSDYAYVGDPEKPDTWSLRIDDKAHVQAALARFNQTELPAAAKPKVIRKLLSMAKKYGIDASGFKKEYAPKKTAQSVGFTNQQSLEDIRDEINDALAEKFGDASQYPGPKYWIVETFPSYVIVRSQDRSDDLYQIPYSMDGDDNISFGDPQAVDVAYIPIESTGGFSSMAADGADDWVFPVVMMKAGFANGTVEHAGKKMRQYFDENIIHQVALAANGGKFGRRHPHVGENENAMPERIAGWLDNGRVIDSGDSAMAVADVHLLKSETQLQSTLLAARQANKLDLFGVSVLAYFGYVPAIMAGEPVLKATKLAKFSSLDWCAEPAAGGRFLESIRTAAARELPTEVSTLQREAVKPPVNDGHNHGGAGDGADQNAGAKRMKDKILTLLAALRKKDAGRATVLETEFTALAEDKHGEFLTKLAEETIAALPAPAAAVTDENNPIVQARTALAQAKKIQSETLIQTRLNESKLAGTALEYLKTSFANRIADGGEVTDEWIKTEIDRARTAFASFSNVGRVRAGGVSTGLETVEKMQLALDGMFGIKNEQKIPAFRGIREAYVQLTGDSDFTFRDDGVRRTSQAISMGDFPNLLLNSMTKRLLQDYAELGMGGLEQLVTTGAPIPDYKTQDRVREGYLGDLATVAEGAPYVEYTKPTDERLSYAVSKRGNILTISEETIRTDDLGAIARFPGRIARASRRTLKQYVTNFFINNPNYGVDGVAWFNGAHDNLGSVALSIDELVQREIALMTQTEKDSGKPLGFRLNWLMVPPALRATAVKINKAEFYNPGPMIQEPNPYYGAFGAPTDPNPKGIIVNELLTDATDWYWGTDQSNAPFLEIGYLSGFETPQILLASLPTQGTLFTNDQIQYKAKFVFGGVPIDYRSVGKSVVA